MILILFFLLLFILLLLIIFFINSFFTGPLHFNFKVFSNLKKSKPIIKGFTLSGYESVKSLFLEILENGLEEKAQVCAYVNGKEVVNLIGIYDEKLESTYDINSIQNIFSSSKAVTSIIVAMLVDKGYLSYDQRIVDIWPEFEAENKSLITIEDLMKHEAGMERFSFSLNVKDLHRESIKNNNTGKLIAATTSTHVPTSSNESPETKRKYHSLTRGFIINEIVRRVDPKGRTVGEILHEDIAKPLNLESQITLGSETIANKKLIAPLTRNKPLWILLQLFNFFNRKMSFISGLISLFLHTGGHLFRRIQKLLGYTPTPAAIILGDGYPEHLLVSDFFNHEFTREAEIPSANIHANANALARIASIMACEGTCPITSKKFISSLTHKNVHDNITTKYDHVLHAKTRFNRGGWCVYDTSFGYYRHGSVGWMGLGGSALQWHNDLKIGFGYTCTLIGADLLNGNSALLQNEIIRCAQKNK